MGLARGAAACGLSLAGCLNVDTPSTNVVVDNQYPPSAARPLVVYEAHFQAITLDASTPIAPGGSSGPIPTIPASDNTAYVVLAPGWEPDAGAPASFLVLQSRSGFGVHLGDTLHIPVDDATFAGNCVAGWPLTQSQADFITKIVFPDTFAGVHYDALTCTATPVGSE
ncbi:MAG TPA: hypothetical protein VKU41_23110 [Polyangiaceae bacterium]|nr:hypothetical protein [Polyangiaceae bacterium]